MRRGRGLRTAVLAAALGGTGLAAATTPAARTADGPTVVALGPQTPVLGSSSDVDPDAAISGILATPTGRGYLQFGPDGRLFAFGDAVDRGSMAGTPLNQPIVAGALTPTGKGYWLVAGDGGVFAFGDAPFLGSTGDLVLNQPIVAAGATPTGLGYWLVASDGGVFTFGDAAFLGSTGDVRLNEPVAAFAPTRTGRGYWLVASDGGVFTFGDAAFAGAATGATRAPVDDIAADPDGAGYWLLTGDGAVFPFDAPFHGAAEDPSEGALPAVGIAAAGPGRGYWIARSPVRALPRGGTRLFPGFRVVAHYGRPSQPGLGVLGTAGPDEVAAAVAARGEAYARFGRPVLPAFEIIASLATAGPGPDGDHSAPIDGAVLDEWLAAARRHRMLLLLDIQPGRADFLTEVRRYERWLAEPDVGVALDPEWSVRAPDRPGGGRIGSTDGPTVNRVADYLVGLVRTHRLPQKLLVVHQFTRPMVVDRDVIRARPELAVTFHADGFGGPAAKASTYQLVGGRPPFTTGYKVFLRQDTPVQSPDEVMAVPPGPPDLVTYQ